MKQQTQIPGNRTSEQERSTLFMYALFRWESAAILAIMLILTVFVPDPFQGAAPFWRWWIWIALGVLALALIVGTTLADPGVRARIASQLFRARFDLDAISDIDLRQRIAQALDLYEQMEAMLQRTRDGGLGAQLGVLADDVSNWIAAIYALARRVDDYRSDLALRRDRTVVPAAIQTLETQLAGTTGAEARTDVERALADKQSEWTQLERLDKLVASAASQLVDSQGALETVYTQMQLSAARGGDRRRPGSDRPGSGRPDGHIVQQLRGDVAEQMRILSDLGREIDESHQHVLERA